MKDIVIRSRSRNVPKLNLTQVEEIRRVYLEQKLTHAELAKMFQLSRPVIGAVLHGKYRPRED